MTGNTLKILFTGNYNPDYNRTLVLRNGLKKFGVELIEFPFKKKNSQTGKQLTELCNDVNFVFLPSFTHTDVPFVKKYIDKPLVFDPLISKYMTKVYDYRRVSRFSIRAWRNYLKDKTSMNKADIVIADTQADKDYFSSCIKIPAEKITVIPVGVDTDLFFPRQKNTPDDFFTVGYYGSFAPLHGVDVILDAARKLENETDIRFDIVGDGFLEKQINKNVSDRPIKNLTMPGRIPYNQLNDKINTFDICLGVFGKTLKTQHVIPNKIFHYAACRKCIITMDTPAMRELFTDNKNIIFSNGDPEDLASKIQAVKNDSNLRNTIAENTYEMISREYNEKETAQRLINVYKELAG